MKRLDRFKGYARLYRVNPPLDGHEYVIVSATVVPWSGPETYIFAADVSGAVTSWDELDGSYRGGLSHTKALQNAGYVRVKEEVAK